MFEPSGISGQNVSASTEEEISSNLNDDKQWFFWSVQYL